MGMGMGSGMKNGADMTVVGGGGNKGPVRRLELGAGVKGGRFGKTLGGLIVNGGGAIGRRGRRFEGRGKGGLLGEGAEGNIGGRRLSRREELGFVEFDDDDGRPGFKRWSGFT